MRGRRPDRTGRAALAAAGAVLALAATGASAPAADTPPCGASASESYSMTLRALTGPQGADLRLEFTPAAGCAPVEALKNLQVRAYTADGSKDEHFNVNHLAAPGGVATLDLGPVDRGQRVTAKAMVQTGTPERTYVLRGETDARLRPDLVVAAVHAPPQTLTTRPVDVVAEIGELNGDTAGAATVTLLWGPTVLGTRSVTVPAGGRASVTFAGVALTTAAAIELTALVGEASPAETDTANNARTATVDVSAHELARSRLLVPSLGGYGAQFNQHVFAPVTSAPGSLPDLEAKAKALEPQLVRIFYNENWEEDPTAPRYDPENMVSFIRTVRLADEAGAAINITYQSAVDARFQPTPHMTRFAAVLDDLVRVHGLDGVRWVTIQNEVNDTNVTLAQYNALYRALDAQLVARGLRGQIKLMGGDLVEFGDGANLPNPNHRTWWQYMAANMNDVLDAYSVHIYWNYWDIPRMEFRLRDVHKIVTEELPEAARKPVFVTEFGVRGILNFPGKPAFQPGYWADGTQMSRTNLAAFQQLWFSLVSAQLGYSGTVKWDAYWGRYDLTYNASHWLIGPAAEGWPLMPAYHAFRLLLQTTQRGWQVLGVDPWADDDWAVGLHDQREQELAAFAGPNGELTLMGLDTNARGLNAASETTSAYSIGGLPPFATFNLALWNPAANGENAIAAPVTASAAGVARFEAPLHAAFSLTTVPVS